MALAAQRLRGECSGLLTPFPLRFPIFMSSRGIGSVARSRFTIRSNLTSSDMTTPLEPAFHIPLTDAELKLIGEICAIQGQIEYLIHNIVEQLLGTSRDTTNTLLGSTSIRTNSEIFIKVMEDKCHHEKLKSLAESILTDIKTLSEGRNDFIHALYAQSHDGGGFSLRVRLKTSLRIAEFSQQ
jgi:hypothetical protein